jgi:hypothetical protein
VARLPGIVLLLLASGCSMGPPTPVHLAGEASTLVVLMVNMKDLGLEWEFFDRHSDSLAAGIVRAEDASWCARIPVPPGAETARLFNGLEDLVIDAGKQPFWTLRLASGHSFVADSRPPC